MEGPRTKVYDGRLVMLGQWRDRVPLYGGTSLDGGKGVGGMVAHAEEIPWTKVESRNLPTISPLSGQLLEECFEFWAHFGATAPPFLIFVPGHCALSPHSSPITTFVRPSMRFTCVVYSITVKSSFISE